MITQTSAPAFSLRSAAAAQAPGKPDLARAVELSAWPVSLAASLAHQKLMRQQDVAQRGNDGMGSAHPSARAMLAGVIAGEYGFAEASLPLLAGQINSEGNKQHER